MWSDVSRAEAKFGGAWVPVKRLTRGCSGGTAEAEAATKPKKSDGLAAEETWVDDWATSELVPAVRERCGADVASDDTLHTGNVTYSSFLRVKESSRWRSPRTAFV